LIAEVYIFETHFDAPN